MRFIEAGVKFGPYHSFRDWGLVLESDEVQFPDVSCAIDDLPVYGISDFDAKKTYGRRTLSFEFGKPGVTRWPELVKQVTAALHGKKLEIVRDCEPDRFYIGRCSVKSYTTYLHVARLKIEVNAEPFSYSMTEIAQTFSSRTEMAVNCLSGFETPAIITINPQNSLAGVTISGIANDPNSGEALSITVRNLTKNRPVIIDGYRKTVTEDGENKYPDCEIWQFPTLLPGENLVTSNTAYSDITISYRKKFI